MWTKLQMVREKPLNAKHVKWVHKGLWESSTAEWRGLNVSHWDVSNFTTVRSCHCITWPDPSITAHGAENLSRPRLHRRNNNTGNLYSRVVLSFQLPRVTRPEVVLQFPFQDSNVPQRLLALHGKGCEGFAGQCSALPGGTAGHLQVLEWATREMDNPPGNKLVNWLQRWRKIPSIFIQVKSFQREERAVTKNTCTCMWLDIHAFILGKSQK